MAGSLDLYLSSSISKLFSSSVRAFIFSSYSQNRNSKNKPLQRNDSSTCTSSALLGAHLSRARTATRSSCTRSSSSLASICWVNASRATVRSCNRWLGKLQKNTEDPILSDITSESSTKLWLCSFTFGENTAFDSNGRMRTYNTKLYVPSAAPPQLC